MKKLQRTSRQAGFAYLAIFFSAIFANFMVLQELWVPSDALSTTQNIAENRNAFNWGVVAFAFTYVVDIILSYLLFVLFRSAGVWMAALSSVLRFIYTYIFGIGIIALFKISMMDFHVIESVADIVLLHIERFNRFWTGGLLLFGTHLGILGILIYRSRLAPRAIGVLLMLAGLGYWIDGGAQFLLPNYAEYKSIFELIVIIPAVVGELALTLFLLFKGISRDKELSSAQRNEKRLDLRS